jgi:hypothetical protein
MEVEEGDRLTAPLRRALDHETKALVRGTASLLDYFTYFCVKFLARIKSRFDRLSSTDQKTGRELVNCPCTSPQLVATTSSIDHLSLFFVSTVLHYPFFKQLL